MSFHFSFELKRKAKQSPVSRNIHVYISFLRHNNKCSDVNKTLCRRKKHWIALHYCSISLFFYKKIKSSGQEIQVKIKELSLESSRQTRFSSFSSPLVCYFTLISMHYTCDPRDRKEDGEKEEAYWPSLFSGSLFTFSFLYEIILCISFSWAASSSSLLHVSMYSIMYGIFPCFSQGERKKRR